MRGLDFSVRKWYFFFLFLLNYSDFFPLWEKWKKKTVLKKTIIIIIQNQNCNIY